MSKLYLENGWLSMNKAGELLCGDHVETVNREDSVIMVLADGLGSGVKASILSTLTSKILATMLAGDMTVEDSVETIALPLPVCAVRQVAYCTFTILQVDKNTGEVYLVQFDNPDLILLRGGKIFDYPKEKREIAGKTIYETRLMGRTGDLYIMMSDGAVHAGVGTVLNFGWQQPEIAEYAQRVWTPDLSAKSMAAKISDACRELYMDIPGDDTTIAALRIRQRQQVHLMIGPPMDPAQDEAIMGDFFALEGKTIAVSGFGNMAWGVCRKAAELGAKVVTLSGPDGYVYDPDGVAGQEKLDFLLEMRDSGKDRVSAYAGKFGVEFFPGKKPWEVKTDIVIPCATQNELDVEDAICILANDVRYYVEGANMPATAEAMKLLRLSPKILTAGAKASGSGGAVTEAMRSVRGQTERACRA